MHGMHDVRGGDQVGCIACALRAGWASPAGHASVRRLRAPPPPPPLLPSPMKRLAGLRSRCRMAGLRVCRWSMPRAMLQQRQGAGARHTPQSTRSGLARPRPPSPPHLRTMGSSFCGSKRWLELWWMSRSRVPRGHSSMTRCMLEPRVQSPRRPTAGWVGGWAGVSGRAAAADRAPAAAEHAFVIVR